MRKTLATILLTTALLLAGLLAALPLLWMLANSFVTSYPGEPLRGSLDHYRAIFTTQPALLWLANSLFVAGTQTVLAVICGSLAGYVLARHDFRGRRRLHVLLVATLLLPAQVTLPAAWQLMLHLQLLDSYLGLVLPAAGTALGALLFYQACKQIPDDTLDAARIDGCSEFRCWWEIALPAVSPTLVTFAVLSFTANWNAYLWPQILLQDERKFTLAIGLANLAALPAYRSNLGMMLAATSISIVPCVILFMAARNSLRESITEGAVR
jgi:ABC-type glycerol-3-phosphate transport system permease component